jgi:uncharacterized protein YbgA (DUF1722 family)
MLKQRLNVVLHIPDDFVEQLAVGGDIERRALEALAVESYRAGRLSKAEVRSLLGFQMLNEVDAFLKAHEVYDLYTLDDVQHEVAALQRLGF